MSEKTQKPSKSQKKYEARSNKLVAAVKKFAAKSENYEAGWDVVVEATKDEELARVIGMRETEKNAIAAVRSAIVRPELEKRQSQSA